MRYDYLVCRLKEASRRSRCSVRGFHEMTAAEISFTCNLPLDKPHLQSCVSMTSLFAFSI
jgi:hypothetical protein